MKNFYYSEEINIIPIRKILVSFFIIMFMFFIGSFITVILLKFGKNIEISTKNTVVDNLDFFYIMLSFVISFIGIIIASKYLTLNVKKFIFDSINKKLLLISFFYWLIILFLQFMIEKTFNLSTIITNNHITDSIILFFISIPLIIIQTGFEEVFFRGYINKILISKNVNFILAIFISSLFFSLLHMANNEVYEYGVVIMFSYYFMIGFMLSLISFCGKNIIYGWIFHFINNFISIVIFSYSESSIIAKSFFITKDNHIVFSFVYSLISMVVFLFIVIITKKRKLTL